MTQGDLTQDTGTSRTYTVSGLTVGTAINIDLVDPTSITAGAFTLVTPANRVADLAPGFDNTNVTIDEINGVSLGGSAAQHQVLTPTTTSITFRVKSPTGAAATSEVPVVFAGSSNVLDVNLNGVPTTQAFGIGGMITFVVPAQAAPAEAANGAAIGGTVNAVFGSTGFNTTVTNTQFIMHTFDIYKFGATVITEAQFQSILSKGDIIATGTYVKGSTTATPNTFDITTDAPLFAGIQANAAPAVGSVKGAVTVTYTPDSTVSVNGTNVTLQRANVVSGVTGSFANLTDGTVSSLNQQTFTETLTDGTYHYRLIYTAPAFAGVNTITSTEISHPVVVNPAAAAPVVQRLYLTSNATSINNLNKGDVFKIAVTAPVVQPIFGATLTLGADTFKYAAVISAGNNPNDVTVTVNTATEVVDGVSHAAGTVITVKLLADPTTPLTFTATTGPALTGSLGFADSSARNLDTTGSLILTQDVTS